MSRVLTPQSSAQSSVQSSAQQHIDQIPCAPRVQPNAWVTLRHIPSPYSFDEALLLCQVAFDEWLAWVPDYGQINLKTDQFDSNL